ncbi:eCIS core domain-containing protein [Streptomyces paradoxus]|uniref:eCIS core domain-containing protein n=1 Tax=Streptomyces paradoxus TaxID=66375 RepID=UPI0037FED0BC
MSNSRTQDGRSEQPAEQRRRKRKERAARSRAPEPKDIVSGAGQPLDPGVRRELEERLGHDLSRVRLHTGRDAGQLADLLGADAVAVGQDILFREGAYRPGTEEGRRLLAHELLHTVQNPHGLGALRAGRELGAVSLPQQAIEREAETTAQDLVRDTGPGAAEAAPDVEQGQATPGWLRYATVDADRRRMEQLDPATLVDRIANGLLRSLRGDPEDRSGRVRVQLARMAPEVQDSVLDRLELRLPAPVVDRLLESVEETQDAGPLRLEAATAPHALPGTTEEIEAERAREDSEAERAPEQDARPARPGKPGGTPRDGRPAPGGGREENTTDQDGGSASGEADRENAQGGAGSAGRQQKGSKEEQERSQEQQDDKDASGRDAAKDADDERKDASATERAQRDQDEQDERDTEEEPGGSDEGSAQEPEKQAGEQEQREGAAEATRRQAPAPGTVDRSGAEPGERPRTGREAWTSRTAGDLENEQDADDEPLGLEPESEQGEAGDVPTGEAPGGEEAPPSEADLLGHTDAAKNASLVEERQKGTAPRPPLPSTDVASVSDGAQQDERPGTAQDAPSTAEETTSGDDVPDAVALGPDSGQRPGADRATEAAGADTGAARAVAASGGDRDRNQAEERTQDAEAGRRDEEARPVDGATSDEAPQPGEATAPDRLAKANEDARTQSAASPPAGATAPEGAARGESAGRPQAARSDGTEQGAGAAKGTAEQDGEAAPKTGDRRGEGAGPSMPAPESTPAPGGQDVAEGKGDATTPGPRTGPEKVSTPGPAGAPELAPGNGPSPMSGRPEAATNAPRSAGAPGSPAQAAVAPGAGGSGGSSGASTGSRARPAGGKRQAARKAAKTASRRGGGGGGGRTSPAPAPVRSGGRGGGRAAAAGGSKARAKKETPPPDVSDATPESGLSTAAGLKPHQALETLKGVGSAVGRSVDEERTTLRKAPPKTQRPSGSPRTVPGGPKAAAPGTYTNAKVARTDAAQGRTPEIKGEQKPEGEVPGANVPEPSWWDIAVTIGAQLFGKLLKEILPLDDLIDSILGLPTKDEGLKNARVGDAPRLPLENDSDPQRTDEQGHKLDERKNELHRSGREDAARPMGEDQIYPDVPRETLTGKVAGGKKGAKTGGTRSVSGGGVPIESASAVAEHDRGPQIQAGFSQGRQKMGQERQTKDKKAADDRKQHDQDLQKEVTASGKKQSAARDKGRSDIADSRDRWRKEQDDKVSEIDDKKGKKYDKVRDDIKKKEEGTDKDVDKRTEDDNKKIDDEQTRAEKEAEKKQEDGKDDADNWLEEAIEKLKEFFENLKNAIKSVFEKARQVVTDLIDKFKQQVFKLIDDARNWVIDQINTFADALIALGDELLADYPAMRDKWRNTIDGARDWAVQKVNEAADALKEVAGKLLDGLCGALLAGLDALEGGLLAAVDIAETVTVGALEFGAAAVAALGEWAAIFNDIVSDPGDWIGKAGAAAETGAKEHLFEEIKTAVRAWFNQKVQEIIGIPMEDFQELISGGVTVEQMAQMAWDEALPQLPFIIGVMVVEKVVAKLIPGAGWVMAVIDALQAAWGALSEILAAFGLFMDFLKSVKSGNGALPFAKAVAAGVVALLELVYTFLVEGVGRFMGKVADRLGDMLKKIRTKKDKPGPGRPEAPDKPGDDKPEHDRPRDEGTRDTDKSADRPAPRKPSPDKTSRPPSKPRPGKRPSPEKKSRPSHSTRPKKRRDDERREEGREVNTARRRARDAERRLRDDDRDERGRGTERRGPARDTLRDRRRPGADRREDRDRDARDTRPHDRGTDDKRRPDERRRDTDSTPDRRSRDRDRQPGDRPRRSPLRRARQTVKAAVDRTRRAARKLYGKARRRLGNRLNDRLRRLLDRWRRRHDRDRTRDRDRTGRRDNDRRREESRQQQAPPLPQVRFRRADGELHTLLFNGRTQSADLVVRSVQQAMSAFFADWQSDIATMPAGTERNVQTTALNKADALAQVVDGMQNSMSPRSTTASYGSRPIPTNIRSWQYKRLQAAMVKLARLLEVRDTNNNNDIPPAVFPPFVDNVRARNFKAYYLQQGIPKGQPAGLHNKKPPNPVGWSQALSQAPNNFVKMHLLPFKLGGLASGSNLVPAPSDINTRFHYGVEDEANTARSAAGKAIWYTVRVKFRSNPHEFFPENVMTRWNYHYKSGNTWRERPPITAPKHHYTEDIPLPKFIEVNRQSEEDRMFSKYFKASTGMAAEIRKLSRQRRFRNVDDLTTRLEKHLKATSSPLQSEFSTVKAEIRARHMEGLISY